jgi:ribosomal protein L19E
LKSAGQSAARIADAEVWMTALRERRNSLHWGKAKSFIADHSETATLLMAAPLHIGTLECIRTQC